MRRGKEGAVRQEGKEGGKKWRVGQGDEEVQ
jgi:hypothetical protein